MKQIKHLENLIKKTIEELTKYKSSNEYSYKFFTNILLDNRKQKSDSKTDKEYITSSKLPDIEYISIINNISDIKENMCIVYDKKTNNIFTTEYINQLADKLLLFIRRCLPLL